MKKKTKRSFKSYAKHKLEAWHLRNVKNVASQPASQQPGTLVSVSDFAQNLKLSRKQETSEEYFHKTQIAIYGTVSNVKNSDTNTTDIQHSLSQITSSDVK